MFQATTYDELAAVPESERMIAVVQCEDAVIESRGSRRERVTITTKP